MITFWNAHGTKITGTLIALLSAIATGSVIFPPPLNTHSMLITQWAAFLNLILGVVVVGRGVANTNAIAAAVQSNTMKVIFMTLITVPLAMAVLTLQGCSTTAQNSVYKSLYTTATLNDTVVNAADAALKSGGLTKVQAQDVLTATDEVEAALTVANTAYQAGDATTATAKVTSALSALTAIQKCMSVAATQVSFCLQGVSAP